MNRTSCSALMFVTLLAAASSLASGQASTPRPVGTSRTDLQRHELSIPGREVLQALVTLAPGAHFPRHRHPGEEIIYVTNGTLEYEVAGKWVSVKTGEVLFVPYGGVHAARNPGSEPATELATYVVEKGKPLTEFVK